jgi:hypothetical protein
MLNASADGFRTASHVTWTDERIRIVAGARDFRGLIAESARRNSGALIERCGRFRNRWDGFDLGVFGARRKQRFTRSGGQGESGNCGGEGQEDRGFHCLFFLLFLLFWPAGVSDPPNRMSVLPRAFENPAKIFNRS